MTHYDFEEKWSSGPLNQYVGKTDDTYFATFLKVYNTTIKGMTPHQIESTTPENLGQKIVEYCNEINTSVIIIPGPLENQKDLTLEEFAEVYDGVAEGIRELIPEPEVDPNAEPKKYNLGQIASDLDTPAPLTYVGMLDDLFIARTYSHADDILNEVSANNAYDLGVHVGAEFKEKERWPTIKSESDSAYTSFEYSNIAEFYRGIADAIEEKK